MAATIKPCGSIIGMEGSTALKESRTFFAPKN
jgi:hypothetical protein